MTAPSFWRRALALTILLAPAVLTGVLVGTPLWQYYRTTRAAAEEHEARIVRLLGITAEAERVSGQAGARDTDDGLHRYLIGEANATLSAAALQKRVKAVVERSGGRLASTQVLDSRAAEGFVHVTVAARLTLDTPALQRVLYELESRLPLLVVDEFVAVSRGGGESGADLDVQLQISGWMLAPGGST